MNPRSMTAAHKYLPLGMVIRVVNQTNGLSANVRIVDRGPFIKGRILDLTPVAARSIGMNGIAHICIEAT
jgi:rare lipoprotein A